VHQESRRALRKTNPPTVPERGQHRAPSVADLLIAASAERVGLTLLHVDKDFELISAVTGQATELLSWVEPEPVAR
jgi:predicted nucleic acid-binding protein